MIDKFEHEGNLRRIFAAILVDKSSQRPILIGAGGEVLKRIGTEARLDMQKLFGGPVCLAQLLSRSRVAGRRTRQCCAIWVLLSGVAARTKDEGRMTTNVQRFSVAAKLAQRLLLCSHCGERIPRRRSTPSFVFRRCPVKRSA